MSNEHAFIRIANKQTSMHVAAREIGAHIEFAGIPGRRDRFHDAKKFAFIAKLRFAAPAGTREVARRAPKPPSTESTPCVTATSAVLAVSSLLPPPL